MYTDIYYCIHLTLGYSISQVDSATLHVGLTGVSKLLKHKLPVEEEPDFIPAPNSDVLRALEHEACSDGTCESETNHEFLL